jgi:hypothetical protein
LLITVNKGGVNMSKVSISAEFRSRPTLRFPFPGGEHINQDAFLKRMERLDARREKARADAAKPASQPQCPDAALLEAGEALENAWRFEVAALIMTRRLNNPEVAAVAQRARAATEAMVTRIEAMKALTLAGLAVKARAILWRRDGEPLEEESGDAAAGGGPTDMEMSHDR